MKAEDGINIAVAPLGAVGTAIAANLMLAQGDQLAGISRNNSGLVREYGIGSYGAVPSHWKTGAEFEVRSSLSQVNNAIDWLLLPAPTFALEQIAHDIDECPAITENTRVLQLNNGWLDFNPIAKVTPPHRLYQATVMVGCLRRSPNVIEVTVNGGINIGSLTGAPLDAAQGLAAALSSGGLTARLTNQIGSEIFRKLSFNNVGAVSALHRMPLGGLLRPEFTSSVTRIAIETWQASIDAGHRSFDSETAAVEDVFSRIRKAENHWASIAVALCNRRRTENDSLCGAVVRISRTHGWFANECARVWQEIRSVENYNRAQEAAAQNPELAGAA